MSRIEKSVRVLIAVAIAFVVAALTLGTIIYYSFVDNVRDWLWLLPVSVIVGLSYLAAHIADGGKILAPERQKAIERKLQQAIRALDETPKA